MSIALCFENEQCDVLKMSSVMFWKWAVPYVLKMSTAMFWKWALPCFENEHCHASCLPEIPGQTRISNAHPVFFLSVDSGSHEWIKKTRVYKKRWKWDDHKKGLLSFCTVGVTYGLASGPGLETQGEILLLKGQCHEIFALAFCYDSNPSGPFIQVAVVNNFHN